MLRQRPVAQSKMWASGLILTLVAAGAIVASVVFTNSSVAAAPSAATVRVSVGSDGKDVDSGADSTEPAISADGRYVAFSTDQPFSEVDGLAPSRGPDGTETGLDADVYVRDTVAGTTTLISYRSPGDPAPAIGASTQPTISADGRFIAFRTTDARIAPSTADTTSHIVVCDRDADGNGRFDTDCAFTPVNGGAEWDVSNPHLAADGRQISYDVAALPDIEFAPRAGGGVRVAALAGAVGPDPDSGIGWVSLVNLRRGTDGKLVPPGDAERTTISAPSTLRIGDRDFVLDSQGSSTLAAGGGHVAFVASYAFNDPDGSLFAGTVFDYDIAAQTDPIRLDVDEHGTPLAGTARPIGRPTLSGDGRRYAFTDVIDNVPQIRLYDRDSDGDGLFWPTAGEEIGLDFASRTTGGETAVGVQPALSADGRYLAFTTPSANVHNGVDAAQKVSCLGRLAPTTVTSYCDIVVRDAVLDAKEGEPRRAAELVSRTLTPTCTGGSAEKPCEGTGDSGLPTLTGGRTTWLSRDGGAALSADGSAVAFGSAAPDLVEGDTAGHVDVFARRFHPSLTGDPQDFGQVPLGSQAIRDMKLSHVGNGPLAVAAVTVGGPNASEFAVFPAEDCTGRVLYATDDCTVSVRFLPAALGTRTAVLTVTLRDDTSLELALTGTAVPAPVPNFTARPDRLAFGARGVLRTSPPKVVTVSNNGRAPLQLTTVALGVASATSFPADYRIGPDTCADRVIAAGGSCTISIRHRPTAVGERPATLAISYVGPDGETVLTHAVPLTGTGTPPTLTAAPPMTPAGRVTQVRGENYPPGSTVLLDLFGMPGTKRVKADSHGRFAVQLVIMPNTYVGTHLLTGAVKPASAPDLAEPLTATMDFLIVPGTPLPPDYHIRM